ncbi:MAG: HIT family protein [Gemmatimonadetes bacterium]|nr:HIT family protein [Gemmatimonadota bacterium]
MKRYNQGNPSSGNPGMESELLMARRDWYCEDVLSGKLNVERVYEDELVLAFHHPEPVADVHVVVIPKAHVGGLMDGAALDGNLLSSMVQAVQQTATVTGLLNGEGFYVRANAAAPGVTPHMHWHVIGPGAGADWPDSGSR